MLVRAAEFIEPERIEGYIERLHQAMALYPATTLCEQLLLPLLGHLEARWQTHPTALRGAMKKARHPAGFFVHAARITAG